MTRLELPLGTADDAPGGRCAEWPISGIFANGRTTGYAVLASWPIQILSRPLVPKLLFGHALAATLPLRNDHSGTRFVSVGTDELFTR